MGSSQNWTIFRGHFYAFKLIVQDGGYFLRLLKLQIYLLECLKFLIFLGVNGRCWARVYVSRKYESTTPPPTVISTY